MSCCRSKERYRMWWQCHQEVDSRGYQTWRRSHTNSGEAEKAGARFRKLVHQFKRQLQQHELGHGQDIPTKGSGSNDMRRHPSNYPRKQLGAVLELWRTAILEAKLSVEEEFSSCKFHFNDSWVSCYKHTGQPSHWHGRCTTASRLGDYHSTNMKKCVG